MPNHGNLRLVPFTQQQLLLKSPANAELSSDSAEPDGQSQKAKKKKKAKAKAKSKPTKEKTNKQVTIIATAANNQAGEWRGASTTDLPDSIPTAHNCGQPSSSCSEILCLFLAG